MLIDVNTKEINSAKPHVMRRFFCWLGFHKYRKMRVISHRQNKAGLAKLIWKCRYCKSKKDVV